MSCDKTVIYEDIVDAARDGRCLISSAWRSEVHANRQTQANASLCVSTNQYKNYISQTLKDFTVLLLPFPDILAFQSS
jgi:hypothetical protein